MPLEIFAADPDWSEPIRERPEYLTDIMRMYDDHEQRVELRSNPRTLLSYRVLCADKRESATLAAKLFRYQGQLMGAPFWPDAQPLTASVSEGGQYIPVDVSYRRFVVGGLAILWRDPYTYEVVEISDTFGTAFNTVDPLTMDWPADGRTQVIPLLRGRLGDSQTIGLPTSHVSELNVTFECEEPDLSSTVGAGRGPAEPAALHECPIGLPEGTVNVLTYLAAYMLEPWELGGLFSGHDLVLPALVEGQYIVVAYPTRRDGSGIPTISDTQGNDWVPVLGEDGFGFWYCVAHEGVAGDIIHFGNRSYDQEARLLIIESPDAAPVFASASNPSSTPATVTLDAATITKNLFLSSPSYWQAVMMNIGGVYIAMLNANLGFDGAEPMGWDLYEPLHGTGLPEGRSAMEVHRLS